MERKSVLTYKIVFDYQGTKRYEDVSLITNDRNEAMLYFLELLKKKQSCSLILDSDCRVALTVELNTYKKDGISLMEFKEDDNLNEILVKKEKGLTTPYENFKYTIKIPTSSGLFPNYKSIFETEIRDQALEKFLFFFRQNQLNMLTQEIFIDKVLEVSISPFDKLCLHLKNVEEESYILSELTEMEQMVILHFQRFNS